MENTSLVKPKKLFMSAGWHNLLLFNYSVSPEVLKPHLPNGAELDLLNGSAHVSLVAFEFLRTRVMGVCWPGFTNFTEINLRFYVKYNGERGVCFIREYVPSWIVAQIARVTYNEPYKSAKMSGLIDRSPSHISAEYKLKDGNHGMRFYAKAENQPFRPDTNSIEHHFKEHELGVGRDRQGRLLTYRVHHEVWNIYPVTEHEIQVDAEPLYGKEFAFLSNRKPDSVVFAAGSDIEVYAKGS